jgi:hypothetical protein
MPSGVTVRGAAAALPGMGLKYDDRFTHTHLGDRPEANGVPGG